MASDAAAVVVVSKHAAARARLRLGAADGDLDAQIDAALEAGRWSRRPPRWLRKGGHEARRGVWFAWPEGRRAVFIVRDQADGRRVVVTVLSR